MLNHFGSALLLVTLSMFSAEAYSQTIWCRGLNIGCPNEEDKQKAMENCKRLASSTKREALNEAIADPQIWKLAGARSAQDYAQMRENTMMSICLKNTT